MVDFPCPDILDPNFGSTSGRRDQAEDGPSVPSLEDRFRAVCEYGRALWNELAETRRYLRDEVAGSDGIVQGNHPALLRDQESWQKWAALYEEVCAVLAGTHGDNGFGRSEATLIARTHGVEIR